MAVNNQQMGAYLPTTSVYDVQQINSIEGVSPDLKELLIRLYQNLNVMAVRVNQSVAGFLPEQQFINGKLLYPSKSYTYPHPWSSVWRQVYIKVITFGTLPNSAGTISVAHNIDITGLTTFITINGAANDPSTSFIPLPYASPTLADNISVEVTATDVVITVGKDQSAYTSAYVVLEYVQQ